MVLHWFEMSIFFWNVFFCFISLKKECNALSTKIRSALSISFTKIKSNVISAVSASLSQINVYRYMLPSYIWYETKKISLSLGIVHCPIRTIVTVRTGRRKYCYFLRRLIALVLYLLPFLFAFISVYWFRFFSAQNNANS